MIPFRLRNTSGLGDNSHHCFVDMASSDQAQAAVKALDGTPFKDGGPVRVNVARPHSGGQLPRDDSDTQKARPRQERGERQERPERKERPGMASGSWRKAE